jgi:hypothetical protein
LKPIAELWNEAYNDLRSKDEKLVKDFEDELNEALPGVRKDQTSPTEGQGAPPGREQMEELINLKAKEIEDGGWKMRFKDHQLAVKDMVEPVVGVVKCKL